MAGVDRFLRVPEVLEMYPVSKSTLWLHVRDGIFPAPHKLGPRCTAWKLSEIEAHFAKIGGAA